MKVVHYIDGTTIKNHFHFYNFHMIILLSNSNYHPMMDPWCLTNIGQFSTQQLHLLKAMGTWIFFCNIIQFFEIYIDFELSILFGCYHYW
jgi:hypothetical protein